MLNAVKNYLAGIFKRYPLIRVILHSVQHTHINFQWIQSTVLHWYLTSRLVNLILTGALVSTWSEVCLPSQPATEKHNQEKKAHKHTSWISPKMCLLCLIILQSSYFDNRINKLFTYSRCMICVSCSVPLILTYYVCKGFLSQLPTNQQGWKIWSHG